MNARQSTFARLRGSTGSTPWYPKTSGLKTSGSLKLRPGHPSLSKSAAFLHSHSFSIEASLPEFAALRLSTVGSSLASPSGLTPLCRPVASLWVSSLFWMNCSEQQCLHRRFKLGAGATPVRRASSRALSVQVMATVPILHFPSGEQPERPFKPFASPMLLAPKLQCPGVGG